ncbi:MAG: rod-binding protein [Paracoccaceae bacterium]
MTLPIGSALPDTSRLPDRDAKLFDAAKKLEASFLAEMLKASGLGETSKNFGGGAGEEQFGSLLLDAQARQIVEASGIGLAETLYESLKETRDD